ncbi:hypothetical protein [Blastococcus capsensis]|uniref:hypothetical protein n=1 Tax=Blastococcus capsensis TaxID=1564163 RepID=UPI00253F70C4|nr:hypothetical protein [Blastococcus capsensis]MDK3257101.1 hypothetical protein [Blastococcus capsensis]
MVRSPAGLPVHLLLVTEWLESVSFHLSWPWLTGDVHAGVRQAYRLEAADGSPLPLIDSRVMPLADRMMEISFFDTRALDRAQNLALRLRCRLAEPLAVPFAD